MSLLPPAIAAHLADAPPAALARIEAIPVDLPLHTPINLGGRLKLNVAEIVVVRIETADGTIGWGESASGPFLTGDLIPGMVAAIQGFIAPALMGRDSRAHAENLAVVARALRGNMAAKCAVDLALHDLTGKRLGVPAHELLGGARRTRAAAMWMLGTPSVEADIAEAEAKRRLGYHVFKLKVGTRDVDSDIRAARGVRAAIGPQAVLSVDANTTWSVDKAIRFAEATGDLGIANFEQPLKDDDLDGMACVAASIAAPVCADEGIHGVADIETHAARKAAQGISLKPLKMGGLTPARLAAERCQALGFKINLADKVATSSLATAGLLQLAAALPALDWNVTATNHYLADDLIQGGLAPRDGYLEVPRGPGLGGAIDAAQVERYRRR